MLTQLDMWNQEYDDVWAANNARIHELHLKLRRVTEGKKVYQECFWDACEEAAEQLDFVSIGGCTH